MEKLLYRSGGGCVPTRFDYDFVFSLGDKDFKGLTEIFEKLAAYEDTGLTPEEVAKLTAKKATPLTLDELKTREGKPVYLVHPFYTDWAICAGYEWRQGHETDWMSFEGVGSISCRRYGEQWWAYDAEPEKGE